MGHCNVIVVCGIFCVFIRLKGKIGRINPLPAEAGIFLPEKQGGL